MKNAYLSSGHCYSANLSPFLKKTGRGFLSRRIIMSLIVSVVLALGIVLGAGPTQAADRLVIADFTGSGGAAIPSGWEVKEKKGKADYAAVKDADINAVRLRSSKTSFSLQRAVNINLKEYPMLTWKWKVNTLPAGGDFRKSGTDDQAAQLFLAFSKTRAIVYIWDTTAPEGTMGDAAAPFFMSIKAVVVRSGKSGTGAWIKETRNVYDDYVKLFHEEPGAVAGVRLQINSQHTGTSAESYFADVAFQRRE
jgi:hypothetical protein